jgi:NADPH:quinone reductase-like Zn-dependent oxidoreductase
MKAIVYTRYGPPEVLQYREVPKPTPTDDQVLIKVHASSVNAAESLIIKGTPFLARLMTGGVLKPKHTIPGADVAGRVEAVGRNVTRLKVGDEVFGDMSADGWGAYAEYACARADMLIPKPATITFESAAAVPLAGVTALQGLRDVGKLQAGQKVLINGATGGVGTFAVQIAKALGAEVTAVGRTGKLEVLRALGADHLIDYKQQDITRIGQQYDLILDIAAYRPFRAYQPLLTPTGIYIVAGGSITEIFRVMLFGSLFSKKGGQRFTNLAANPNPKDLTVIKELMEAGNVTSVISKCYPLSETAEAFRYFQSGDAHGKVVISVAQ